MRTWIVPAALGVLLLAVSISAVGSLSRARQFEGRAALAEQYVMAARAKNDLLEGTIARLNARTARRDTVIDTLEVRIAVADSVGDTSAMFAGRDRLIGMQKTQIAELKAVVATQDTVVRTLQLAVDTLSSALAARPKTFPTSHVVDFGPTVVVDPAGRVHVGLGVQIPLRNLLRKVLPWV